MSRHSSWQAGATVVLAACVGAAAPALAADGFTLKDKPKIAMLYLSLIHI